MESELHEAARGAGTSAQIEMIYAIAIQGQVLAIQDAGAAIQNAPSAIQKYGQALQGKRRYAYEKGARPEQGRLRHWCVISPKAGSGTEAERPELQGSQMVRKAAEGSVLRVLQIR